MIFPANFSDAKILTDITFKSKAIWNYSEEQLEIWREDLTVSQKRIEEMLVFKFVQDDEIVGFYILNQPQKQTIELAFLFVLPKTMGIGIGKKLLSHSYEKAKELGCTAITLLADPNAENFYKSQGFYAISQKESTTPNRFLPVMKKDLVL